MLLEDFNQSIDTWIEELDKYSIGQLTFKPATGWSLGQLYMHLINDTNFYKEQIKVCMSNNENADEDKSDFAKTLFANNSFPDIAIKGAPSNAYIKQPGSKEELSYLLQTLKAELNELYIKLSGNTFKGKTKHPGLNYLNAMEWFQFAAIHFRHHLRQRKRIDMLL